MTPAPLILTPEAVAELHRLRDKAAERPVDVRTLKVRMEVPADRRRHLDQMQEQTVVIPGPWPFFVTYSLETGHPVGTARHMSMSIKRDRRVPHPHAVTVIAIELGFTGSFEEWASWPENLSDGGVAINVVQLVQHSQQSAAPS